MEKLLIFLFMAQPKIKTTVPNDNIKMFPFGEYRICTSYQTETFKLPKNHIRYSLSCKRVNIYNIKGDLYVFLNGKRNEYELRYRDFNHQKTLGDKIRYIRLHAGLTKRQLADMTGVHITCINDYELNYTDISFVKTDILYKIEQACGVPKYTLFCDYLLYYETDQFVKDIKELGIRQTDLARYFGVNKNTILRWKNKINRPSIDVWRATIELFQVLQPLSKSDRSLYLSSKDKLDLSKTDCAANE